MTEITNAPDLRFPEFNDKWQMMNLSNIVTTIKGNDNQIDLPILTISAKYGWLTQKERFSQVIAGNSLKRYTKVSRGDLSYNKGNSKIAKYGIVYKMNYDEALVPNVYKSFRPHKGINSSFIEKYFHTKKLDRQLRKYISSTARMDGLLNISDNDFYKVNIYIPNSFEQEKIGDFFSKLDCQIELEEKKLELLEQQKKGYIQKIFSQELRFKDENGNNYPNWEMKKLGNIANIVGGGTPSTKKSEYWDGDINWFSPVEIGDKEFVSTSQRRITEKGLEKSSAKVLPIGTVLFTSRAGIGKTAILSKEATTNQGFQSIVPKENDLDSYFLYSMTSILKRNAEKVGAGSTFSEVSRKQMEQIKLLIPILKEQKQIGRLFQIINRKINKQIHKIELLKQRKKGLLQKMFV